MTESTRKPRSPMRVAIAVLSVAVVVMALIVAYLVWGRSTPTVLPAPTPSASPTTPSPSTTVSTTPTPAPSTLSTAAPATTPASSNSPVATETPTSPSPTAPNTSSAPPVPAPAQTMMWEGKATFEHFSVEVLRDDAPQDTPMLENKAGLPVEVCVVKTLDGSDTARISSDPWTLEDSEGTVQTPQAGGYQPAFPADGEYAVGECARGYLTFDYLPAGGDYANLVYENGLGDRAVWQFH